MFENSLNVLRFVKNKYYPGCTVESHIHNFCHYFYILSGRGNLEIGGVNYEANEDEHYLVPAGMDHSISAKKDIGFHTIEIKFVVQNEKLKKQFSLLPPRMTDVDPKVQYILKDLVQEAYKKELFFEDMINVRFSEIALYFFRNDIAKAGYIAGFEQNIVENKSIESNYSFEKVMRYIKDNIEGRLEIAELASMAGYCEAYFCTVFKEKYGISPRQYILNLKMNKAKELMLYSDLNVTQISELLKFESLHYFSRVFKKRQKITPQEYIQKVKNNLYVHLVEGITDKYSNKV